VKEVGTAGKSTASEGYRTLPHRTWHFACDPIHVGIDHHLDQFRKRDLGLPAECFLGLAGVTPEDVRLCGPKELRIGLDVVLPLQVDVAERQFDEFAERVGVVRPLGRVPSIAVDGSAVPSNHPFLGRLGGPIKLPGHQADPGQSGSRGEFSSLIYKPSHALQAGDWTPDFFQRRPS